jgi:hypothetical protein
VTEPPSMFRRPSDPVEQLAPLRSGDSIVSMHAEWARLHAETTPGANLGHRIKRKARTYATRLGIVADRRLLGDVIRALDAVAARCDELSDRVNNIEITVDDVSRILGEEVTRLRATVERDTPVPPRGSSTQR